MSLLGFLNNYAPGDVISSAKLNAEFNQILWALGYFNNNNLTSDIQIVLSTLDNVNAPLTLDSLVQSDYLELNTNTLFKFSGQLILGANGIVGIVVNTSVQKCINLNADLLQGKNASDLEQKFYTVEQFSTFWTATDLAGGGLINKPKFVCPAAGAIITKLKGRTPDTASADASTIITVYKNGISIGTISIAGNTQAVQTNDIADNTLVAGDEIFFNVTTYTGTTKHKNVTAAIHFKKKLVSG